MNIYGITGSTEIWGFETKAKTSVIIKDTITKEERVLKDKDEYLPTAMQEGNPAYLNISAGMTKNLGDFNSARVSISITYPCIPEEIEESYDKLKNWIDARLIKEIAELES